MRSTSVSHQGLYGRVSCLGANKPDVPLRG